jgi:hypothetical protein
MHIFMHGGHGHGHHHHGAPAADKKPDERAAP